MIRVFVVVLLGLIAVPALSQSVNSEPFDVTYTVDGEKVVKSAIYTQMDTVFGKEVAVYADDTSQVAFIINYRNGQKFGLFQTFYPNGKLCQQGVYSKDKMNGEWAWYSHDGELRVKGKYKEGVQHGFWAFRANGCYGKMKNGKRHGKWYCHKKTEAECICWYKDGKVARGEECPDLKELGL